MEEKAFLIRGTLDTEDLRCRPRLLEMERDRRFHLRDVEGVMDSEAVV